MHWKESMVIKSISVEGITPEILRKLVEGLR